MLAFWGRSDGHEDLETELEDHDTGLVRPAKARRSTLWESDDPIRWERDLLTLFVRNQLRVALALPILAVLFALTNLSWITWTGAAAWLAIILCVQAVQIYLCRRYDQSDKQHAPMPEWIGILAASEFLYASCWSLPLFVFWQTGNDLQHIYLIATLMAVVAIRMMIASNFMPIVVAGTGFITFNILVRCMLEGESLYIALGIMAVIVELFFIQLARRLQCTARDMLIFKNQKEELINELKSAKDQADVARQRAEEASEAKSRFLATMSHELRTPLNAIMGFSEILSHEMMGPHAVAAYKDYSSDIHHSGHYLLNLINDILDLSRIEAGRLELEDKPVSLADEAFDCLKLVDFKAREKNHQISVRFPGDFPKVSGDPRALRQIWLNLISNAIKFTPENGRIELSLERKSNGAAVMSLTDNGPGIPPEEIKIAMSAFSRGSDATHKAIDGAGLGLSIVHGLVKLHGGELSITRGFGQGTKVSIVFPPKRVLDGTRVDILSPERICSPTQRHLIELTA